MIFQCKWGCGSWLHIDSSHITPSGKHIPLTETNQVHDCHLSPWFRAKSGKVKAKAMQIQQLKKIGEYDLIQQARKKIDHLNARLSNYRLELSVKEKQQETLL